MNARFDEAPNAVLACAVGFMLANVLFGLADWLRTALDDALDVDFGGDGD